MLSRKLIKHQPGRRWFKYIAGIGLLVTTLTVAGLAFAVHEFVFQLDGDTSTNRGTTPTAGQTLDWDSLFTATGGNTALINSSNTTGFTAGSFVRDFGVRVSASDACSLTNVVSTTFCTADTTTFATGSKDTLNISPGWQCNKDNNVNSKIDIMNAYAASYRAANGDKIIYFGLDKNKDNGNNNVGFWFLQGNASCVATSGSAPFTGSHSDGDVLVVSAFTAGGGVSNITAYQWAGGANGCIDSGGDANRCDGLSFGNGGDCKVTGLNDNICATTNSGTLTFNGNITTPWKTSDATLGVGNTVVPPNFFEGGINITQIFADSGSTAPSCFNTFIGNTRSSQSLTATLFDFARGQLGECSASITTQASTNATVTPGTQVFDTATITGTSGSTAPFPNSNEATGGTNVKFYICELLASGECTSTAIQVGAAAGVELTPTATQGVSTAVSANYDTTGKTPGRYCFYAVWPGDANYTTGAAGGAAATECFTIAKINPTIATTSSSTGNVTPGTSVTDTANLSGTAGTPTGSVDFFLCQPTDVTAGGCEGSAGTKIGVTKSLSGGSATSDAASGTATTTLGKYCWRAQYGGDGVYNAASHTNAGSECFTVRTSSSGSSQQNWLPNDRVTVSTPTGTVAGTLSIQLIEGTLGTTCAGSTGTVRYTEPVPNGGAFTATVAGASYDTTNGTVAGTTFRATATGNYYWRAVFTPTSTFASGFTLCETTSLTINNNP